MADNIRIPIEILTAEAINEIKAFSKRAEKSLGGIEKSTKRVNSSVKKMGKSFVSLGSAAKFAGGALVTAFAGRAIFNAFNTLTRESEKFSNSLIGVRSVAANFGITANEVTGAVQDLAKDGLVPVQNVANTLKNLLASGLNLEQSTKLFNTLKDSAAFGRQGMLDLGEAIEGASQGIKNSNSIMVDNAGITKNLSVIQKEYATSIGTTVGKLTDAQKVQGTYLGLLKEGAIFSGDAARLTETYSGATARLGFSFKQLQVRLGQFLSRSPQIAKIVALAADGFDKMSKAVSENNVAISKGIKSGVIVALESFGSLLRGIDFLKQGFIALPDFITVVFSNVASVAIEAVNIMIRAFNKLLDVAGIDPFEEVTGQVEKFNEAAKEASKNIENIGSNKGALTSVAEGIDVAVQALKELKPSSNIDDLNKQVKTIGKVSVDSADGVKVLTKESIEFFERTSERAVKLGTTIASALGSTGQSISSALGFASKGGGADQIGKEIDQIEKDLDKALSSGAIDKDTFDIKKSDLKDYKKTLAKNTAIGIGTGFANSIAQGAAGAKSAVIGVAQLGIDAVLPGLGQALGPLLGAITEGPEAVKQFVKEFVDAVPVIIDALIEGIPVFIIAMAEALPVLIEALADRMDIIVLALVDAMPIVAFKLAEAVAINVPLALAKTLPQAIINILKDVIGKIVNFSAVALKKIFDGIKNIAAPIIDAGKQFFDNIVGAGEDFIGKMLDGAGKFIQKIIDGAKDAIGGGISDLGGGIFDTIKNVVKDPIGAVGGIAKSIGKAFGFARGGEIPGGFPNDNFPATLTSGELVVDRSTTDQLKDFLAGSQQNDSVGDLSITNNLLAELVTMMSKEQVIETSVSVDDSTFADILLKLNRNNVRVA